MKTLEYTTQDKSTWGEGEFQTECDKKQWLDEETGYPCLIVRSSFSGALCGYVGVGEKHPNYEVEGYDFNLDVHGGITFTDKCQPSKDEAHGICHVDSSNDNVWWLGFDTAHYMDYAPAQIAHNKDLNFGGTYRNIAYVTKEVQSLARQLKALEITA